MHDGARIALLQVYQSEPLSHFDGVIAITVRLIVLDGVIAQSAITRVGVAMVNFASQYLDRYDHEA